MPHIFLIKLINFKINKISRQKDMKRTKKTLKLFFSASSRTIAKRVFIQYSVSSLTHPLQQK